jgi:hypothetical protein
VALFLSSGRGGVGERQHMACSSASRWRRPLYLEELHRLSRLSGHNGGGWMVSVMVSSPSAWERLRSSSPTACGSLICCPVWNPWCRAPTPLLRPPSLVSPSSSPRWIWAASSSESGDSSSRTGSRFCARSRILPAFLLGLCVIIFLWGAFL